MKVIRDKAGTGRHSETKTIEQNYFLEITFPM